MGFDISMLAEGKHIIMEVLKCRVRSHDNMCRHIEGESHIIATGTSCARDVATESE